MKLRRAILLILVFSFILSCLCACNRSLTRQREIRPEVGKWHAVIKIHDLSGSMSEEDKLLLSMLAGDTMFEIDVEFCEDGTFTYIMNTDQLEEAISNSVSTLIGFFVKYDFSLFIDRLVKAALQDGLQSSKHNYHGTYTVSESGLISATDDVTLLFKMVGNSLVEIDSEGNEVLRFSQSSEQ